MKRASSSFALWRRAIPRLKRTYARLDEIRATLEPADTPMQLALLDFELKANREVRETLHTELRVRREIVELRKLELDGCTEDDLEGLLIRTAKRRGYRRVDGIREELVSFLTKSIGAEAARRIVDRVLPMPRVEAPTKRLDRSLNQSYDRLQEDLEAGAAEIREALAHVVERQDGPQDPKND